MSRAKRAETWDARLGGHDGDSAGGEGCRLARECAKLNRAEEKQLAEEGLVADEGAQAEY